MILQASDLTVRYRGAEIDALHRVGVTLAAGELLAVVGPNGSGKTTLLRALLGTVPLATGEVVVLGQPLMAWSPRKLAQTVGVVTQREESLFPLRVSETVAFGRYTHLGPMAAMRAIDRAVVEQSMRRADVLQLAERRTDTLSGGEWQRVRIARALAQEPQLLVLDEPTASLDVRHEMEVFELVRRLAAQGMATLLVTHHLNLAARYADQLLLLHRGAAVMTGPPAAVLRADIVASVFDWPIAITAWSDGAPQIVPLKPSEVLRGNHAR